MNLEKEPDVTWCGLHQQQIMRGNVREQWIQGDLYSKSPPSSFLSPWMKLHWSVSPFLPPCVFFTNSEMRYFWFYLQGCTNVGAPLFSLKVYRSTEEVIIQWSLANLVWFHNGLTYTAGSKKKDEHFQGNWSHRQTLRWKEREAMGTHYLGPGIHTWPAS